MPLPNGSPTVEVLLTFEFEKETTKYSLRCTSDQEACKWVDKLQPWTARDRTDVVDASRAPEAVPEGAQLTTVIEGVLLKQSGGVRKRWQERDFEIAAHYLIYYPEGVKDQSAGRVALDLTDITGQLRSVVLALPCLRPSGF
jgi:hypothetical protein